MISNQQDFRYEKKILINHLIKDQVRSVARLNPFVLKKSYHPRFINNIYFDNINLQLYHSSVEGDSKRIKIRIRWYGELFGNVKKPVLEIKIKEELLSKKILVPLKSFHFNKESNIFKILELNSSSIKKYIFNWKSLTPTLVNSYLREYHTSFDEKFRVTIDDHLSYYNILSFHRISYCAIHQKESIILEIKYGAEHSDSANHFISKLPLRITKSSKYVQGMELTLL